jgi:hypothetical protein
MTTQLKTPITDLVRLPGKLFAAIGRFIDNLDEAIDLRNRYLELNSLDPADLARLGITRQTISKVVAEEAGLFDTPVAHNSNEGLRSAA